MKFNTKYVDDLRPRLDAVQRILPGAVIAGGYLRDTLLDKPVRDMDVFVEAFPTEKQLADLGALLFGDVNVFEAYAPESHELAEYEVHAQFARDARILGLYKAPGVDIIVTNDIATHLREFPDNISKVSYAAGVLSMTDEFVNGHTQKRIVYVDEAGDARLEKLQAKYPDYAVELV